MQDEVNKSRVNRMRLTERRRELIPQMKGGCVAYFKKAVGSNEDTEDGRARVTV